MLSKLNDKAYLLFLLPTFGIFAVFMFYPLLNTVYLSFLRWNMMPHREPVFVGFENYLAIFNEFNREITLRVIGNTFVYIVLLLILNFVMPFVLAFVLNVVVTRFRNLYKPILFIPSIISLVVGSMIYTWILNPIMGPVSHIMGALGMDMPVWSRTQGLVIVVISVILTWKIFGYNFIVLLGGISGIPEDVIESAKLDKIPLHKIFLNIVMPMSSAVGVYVFVMTIVQGLQFGFIPISILTEGGPNWHSSNLIYQAYHEAFVVFDTGRGAVFSVLTLVLFLFLLWLEFKFVEKGMYYEN